MWKSTRFFLAVVAIASIVSSQRLRADDECSDMKVATDNLGRALSASAKSKTLAGGTFVVKRTPDNAHDTNATNYEIAYVVSGATVASTSLKKGSPQWDEYSYLEVATNRGTLNVSWQTGGSRCCFCWYTVAAGRGGFVVKSSNSSPYSSR